MCLLGLGLIFYFIGTNVQVELRDYKQLGLGWVQARKIREAAQSHEPIPGCEFKFFTDAGELRTVRSARVLSLDQPATGIYRNWQFWTFVVLVKSIGGLWQAVIVYLAVLYIVAGTKLIRHMRTQGLIEKEGSIQWTIAPAILMLVVGILANVFSSGRYVANLAKGSYGSWDQYWGFLVVSPGLATLVLGTFSLYLVYFEARGRANPWAGTPQPYWWALSASATGWLSTSLGVVRLLLGLHPDSAQQITNWIQQTMGGK